MLHLGCKNLVKLLKSDKPGGDTAYQCSCNCAEITPFGTGGIECPRTCALFTPKEVRPQSDFEDFLNEVANRPAA